MIWKCRSPMAKITPAYTKLGIKPAPEMTSFSSQGPNTLTPDILKVLFLNILALIRAARSVASFRHLKLQTLRRAITDCGCNLCVCSQM